MNRQGWLLLLLPDQRATSAIASRSACSIGSDVNSRTWRVCRSGRRRSAGFVLTAAMLHLAGTFGRWTGCSGARYHRRNIHSA
jgi:hypothetical protein